MTPTTSGKPTGTDSASGEVSPGGLLWSPSARQVSESLITRFISGVNAITPDGYSKLTTFEDLHSFSLSEPVKFWEQVWHQGGVIGEIGEGPVFEPPNYGGGDRFYDARWFEGAELSVVENFLRGRDDEVAVIEADELDRVHRVTHGELRAEVATVAAALKSEGVEAGDRVAAVVPNCVKALITMLGAASIGAVFSSTSPDFGLEGICDRFEQIEPKVLFCVDGYSYAGKAFDLSDRIGRLSERLPSVVRVVVTRFSAQEVPLPDGIVEYGDWTNPFAGSPYQPQRFPFSHPWYILFSSGTTGKPKAIVHKAGGVLLGHIREHQLHCDIRPGNTVMWFSTCGWMMWNWLVSALASGATIVAYDGSPSHPGEGRLWNLVEQFGITHLGVSARYLDQLAKLGYPPRQSHDLTPLRMLGSTGSPLTSERFGWVYENVATDLHVASVSGGTDLCGCFVASDPTSPVWAGEIQRPGLGMDIGVVDDSGEEMPIGIPGELVCRNPFPSVPLRFWNDPDNERFQSSYFDTYPGWWHHGDFASRTEHGGFVIHGRSDTTLNPGGVRIGTAEIYRQIGDIDEVLEGCVVSQPYDGDTRIVLLVRLADGVQLEPELIEKIRTMIRSRCSPRHVPAKVVAVDDLPRTRSNKLAELAVADILAGRQVRNTGALANPDVLGHIAKIAASKLV